MQKSLFYVGYISILLIVGYIYLHQNFVNKNKNNNINTENTLNTSFLTPIKIGKTMLLVDVADTNKSRELGLSGSKELEYSEGLLFVFDKPQIGSFWMKDMNYPIDIIWINEQKKVIGVEKSVSPDTFPQTFSSKEQILYVLETKAGFFENKKIQIGDILSL